jgi:predicted O-methyltransferase YrrM
MTQRTDDIPVSQPSALFSDPDLFFGSFHRMAQSLLASGGSELGLGLTLFSLAVSIKAENVIEIGRWKGFSTFCLASALRFIDIGWNEPDTHKQRPDVNYSNLEMRKARKLISIDPFPQDCAREAIETAGLTKYVEFVNAPSASVTIDGQVDLMFIDGDHSYEGCSNDVINYVPKVLRPGGYFILHDYYGWYDEQGRNNSPIKRVADELSVTKVFEQILIDTGYMSFVIYRKPVPIPA